MRILSVKPVLWLAVNLHHLFSNAAAVNTQSRSSLTSYAILRSESQMNRIRFWTQNCLTCQWTTALCINCRSIWEQVMEIYRQWRNRLYWRDAHENRIRLIAQPYFGPLSNSPVLFLYSPGKTLLTLSLVQKWLGSPFPEDVWVWWLLIHWLQLQSTPCEALPSVWKSALFPTQILPSSQLCI